jgi:hypothetical protein
MACISSIDERIGRLASNFGGHVSRRQLVALGLSRGAIEHRVLRGLLIPVYRGVYAVGHLPTNLHDRAKGALLAAGSRSVLSHDSAGSYYGVWKRWRFPLHVTVATDRRINGIVIHRNRRLRRSDIWTPEPGLYVTSPAITMLDVAPRLSERRLRRVVNEIRLEHRIELQQLEDTVGRFPRHPGGPRLLAILQTSQRQPARSGWEDEWPAFAASYGLPAYVMNEFVCGTRADVLFTEERLIVELDGWETHQTREAFVADRERDAMILAQAGIPTVRITYERFHQCPARQAERLHAILARRQAALRLRDAAGSPAGDAARSPAGDAARSPAGDAARSPARG